MFTPHDPPAPFEIPRLPPAASRSSLLAPTDHSPAHASQPRLGGALLFSRCNSCCSFPHSPELRLMCDCVLFILHLSWKNTPFPCILTLGTLTPMRAFFPTPLVSVIRHPQGVPQLGSAPAPAWGSVQITQAKGSVPQDCPVSEASHESQALVCINWGFPAPPGFDNLLKWFTGFRETHLPAYYKGYNKRYG